MKPFVELQSRSAEETADLGRRIAGRCAPGAVIALQGPLGAGKTTLVKGLAQALGVEEPVTSPAFTLVSQYLGVRQGKPLELFHVDLYRLRDERELEDLGLEELLYGRGITAIEWAEKASALLPGDTVWVRIDLEPDGARRLRVEGLEL